MTLLWQLQFLRNPKRRQHVGEDQKFGNKQFPELVIVSSIVATSQVNQPLCVFVHLKLSPKARQHMLATSAADNFDLQQAQQVTTRCSSHASESLKFCD